MDRTQATKSRMEIDEYAPLEKSSGTVSGIQNRFRTGPRTEITLYSRRFLAATRG
jgi:hypothetical protein